MLGGLERAIHLHSLKDSHRTTRDETFAVTDRVPDTDRLGSIVSRYVRFTLSLPEIAKTKRGHYLRGEYLSDTRTHNLSPSVL